MSAQSSADDQKGCRENEHDYTYYQIYTFPAKKIGKPVRRHLRAHHAHT